MWPALTGSQRSSLAGDPTGRNVFLEVACDQAVDMEGCSFALGDGVGAIGVNHKVKRQAEGYELVDEQLGSLEVDVVVAGAVNDEQVAFKVLDKVDGRAVVIALLVGLRQ